MPVNLSHADERKYNYVDQSFQEITDITAHTVTYSMKNYY